MRFAQHFSNVNCPRDGIQIGFGSVGVQGTSSQRNHHVCTAIPIFVVGPASLVAPNEPLFQPMRRRHTGWQSGAYIDRALALQAWVVQDLVEAAASPNTDNDSMSDHIRN